MSIFNKKTEEYNYPDKIILLGEFPLFGKNLEFTHNPELKKYECKLLFMEFISNSSLGKERGCYVSFYESYYIRHLSLFITPEDFNATTIREQKISELKSLIQRIENL